MAQAVWKKWTFTALLALVAWVPLRLSIIDGFWSDELLIRLFMVVSGACLALYFRFSSPESKNWKSWGVTLAPFVLLGTFMLLLPVANTSQSIDNALYFLPVLLWFCIWLSFADGKIGDRDALSRFVRLTGEALVWCVLCILGGAVLVVLSIALFDIVGFDASQVYLENIVSLGLCAAPFVAIIVAELFPGVRLASVLGVIFIPLFLLTITVFGTVIFFATKKPWDNRDVFILYNVVLVLVICLLVFVSSDHITNHFIGACTSILPVITILLDLVVLWAIVYRINNWGITPSKATLLVTNLVMLGNLIDLVVARIQNRTLIVPSARAVAWIPVYAFLGVLIVFVFPFLFSFA